MNATLPFNLGTPVPPERHVGRRDEVQRIFSRLQNGDSTGIVGEPHSGKTSLLQYVTSKEVRSSFLHESANAFAFVSLDTYERGLNYTPKDFWMDVLAGAQQEFADQAVSRLINRFVRSELSDWKTAVEDCLGQLSSRLQRRIVILIDEFDQLVLHPEFGDSAFFRPLRAMIHGGGVKLSLITASRLGLDTLQQALSPPRWQGSPSINYIVPLALKPYSRKEVEELISRILDRSSIPFEVEHRDLVWEASGGNPFLAQCAAYSVFNQLIRGTVSQDFDGEIIAQFYELTQPHFDVVWNQLNESSREVLACLAVVQSGAVQFSETKRREFESTAEFAGFEMQLYSLEGARLLARRERSGSAAAIKWGSNFWTFTADGLRWWLTTQVVRNRAMLEPYLQPLQKLGVVGPVDSAQIQLTPSRRHAGVPSRLATRDCQPLLLELEIVSEAAWDCAVRESQWPEFAEPILRHLQKKEIGCDARELETQMALTAFQVDRILKGQAASLRFGDHILLDELGTGGMARVFRARQLKSNQLRVIKLLKDDVSKPLRDHLALRFQNEWKLLAKLKHPRLPMYYEANLSNESPYMVMEYIPGDSLDSLVRKSHPIPITRVIDWFADAAEALQYCHDNHVIHRDATPKNIMYSEQDGVKLIDLGIAKCSSERFDGYRHLTRVIRILGNPDFMSPEQFDEPGSVEPSADIYTLGCSLFFVITGRPPFVLNESSSRQRRDDFSALADMHRNATRPIASEYRKDSSKSLDELIALMLQPISSNRCQSAAEVAVALRQVGQTLPPNAL